MRVAPPTSRETRAPQEAVLESLWRAGIPSYAGRTAAGVALPSEKPASAPSVRIPHEHTGKNYTQAGFVTGGTAAGYAGTRA